MTFKIFYLDQNLGNNNIKKVKNSNLPIIIPIDKVYLSIDGNWLNPLSGPIILPKPGPTTAIDVIAADIDVMKS